MAAFQEVDGEMPAVNYSRQDDSINIYIWPTALDQG